MEKNLQSFLGWFLLTLGLIIIIATIYLSYNIFTDKSPAPEVFKTISYQSPLSPSLQPKNETTEPLFPQKEIRDAEIQMSEMIAEQLKSMIPIEALPKLLNLISWSIFAGLLIFAGSQVSSLGIKLIKK